MRGSSFSRFVYITRIAQHLSDLLNRLITCGLANLDHLLREPFKVRG